MRGDEVILLHISDIHRSAHYTQEKDRDLLIHLLSDIKSGYQTANRGLPAAAPQLPRPEEIDLLLVTGDLTQHAEESEFNRAAEFLNGLVASLPLVKGGDDRVIIVPGNHDVSWVHSKSAYEEESVVSSDVFARTFKHESVYRLSLSGWPPRIFRRGTDGHRKRLYDERLKAFSDFFHKCYSGCHSFPLDGSENQYIIFDKFSDLLGVVVVAFSSCVSNDHLWRRGWINDGTVMEAEAELDRRCWLREKYLRIAAWHHNISGTPDQTDFMDARVTRKMADAGFSLGFHGHIHEFQQNVPALVRRELFVIGAGSLAAEPDERPPGVPLEYNVVGLSPKKGKAWVHLRVRENMSESWHGGYQCGPERNRCFEPILLTDVTAGQRLIFEKSDLPRFADHIQKLISTAKKVVMIGTGLNILHRDPIAVGILDRAATGDLILEIFLADPNSPAVHTRLIEEELGDKKPPVGRSGLVSNLEALLKDWEDRGSPESIGIRLFSNYPTFALIMVDDKYFIYPYAYTRLGNFSPVLTFSKDEPADKDVIDFLDKHYQLTKSHSIDASKAFDSRAHKVLQVSDLQPFALYFLPARSSPLHEFGSSILGYDAHRGEEIESSWGQYVGMAADFGFHLTVCDVLYFLSSAEIALVKAETKFVLKHFFKPFNLTNLRIKAGFPDSQSVSLRVDDPSGSLEALHHEMVHRVYRRAASSNYECGCALLNRDTQLERARFMIQSYHAPYILQGFTPHFTLLSKVPRQDLSKVGRKLKNLFEQQIRERTVRVERVAFMTFLKDKGKWVVEEEVALDQR